MQIPAALPVHQHGKQMHKFIKFWVPVLLFMGFIFYASSIPGSKIPSVFPYQDIVYHTIIYLILAYFFSRALKNTYVKISLVSVITIAFIFGIFYGITDEFHQSFVSGRTVSAVDVFYDGAGSFLGGLIWRLLI